MTASHVDSPRRAARAAAESAASRKGGFVPDSQPETARNGGARQLLRAIGTGITGAFFVLVLAVAALVIVVPMTVGGQALTVLTNSMAPGMPPGTLVIVKPTPLDDIEVGDVLTYQIRSGDPAVVSHRVISRTVSTTGDTTFITKGDNNDLADPNPVTAVQIRGTVWYSLPLLGWVNSALSGGMRSWIVPIVVVLCFGYGAWAFTSGARDRRRAAREGVRAGKPHGRRSSSATAATATDAVASSVANEREPR